MLLFCEFKRTDWSVDLGSSCFMSTLSGLVVIFFKSLFELMMVVCGY